MAPSAAFCAFWQNDATHDRLLSYMDKKDLQTLRLVCKPFAEDITSLLFENVTINFTANTFSRQARMNALARVGRHFKRVTFSMPHTSDTFLPPLVDPETGREETFNYSPEFERSKPADARDSLTKFGSWEVANLLVQQYPPVFHAATNLTAFIRAFESIPNLQSLTISCPGQPAEQRYRRSAVDYALLSLRMAVEHVCPEKLNTLILAPIHASAPFYLRPFTSLGSCPRSSRVWRRIKFLTIKIDSYASSPNFTTDHYKILHTYLGSFSSLESLDFTWLGSSGPMPLTLHSEPSLGSSKPVQLKTPPCSPPGAYPPSPSSSTECCVPISPQSKFSQSHPTYPVLRPLKFQHLNTFHLRSSLVTSASQIATFIRNNRRTLREFSFYDTHLLRGSWDDALEPLSQICGTDKWKSQSKNRKPRKSKHVRYEDSSDLKKKDGKIEKQALGGESLQAPSPKEKSSISPLQPAIHLDNDEGEDDAMEVPFILFPASPTSPRGNKSPTHSHHTAPQRSAEELQKIKEQDQTERIEGFLWTDGDEDDGSEDYHLLRSISGSGSSSPSSSASGVGDSPSPLNRQRSRTLKKKNPAPGVTTTTTTAANIVEDSAATIAVANNTGPSNHSNAFEVIGKAMGKLFRIGGSGGTHHHDQYHGMKGKFQNDEVILDGDDDLVSFNHSNHPYYRYGGADGHHYHRRHHHGHPHPPKRPLKGWEDAMERYWKSVPAGRVVVW